MCLLLLFTACSGNADQTPPAADSNGGGTVRVGLAGLGPLDPPRASGESSLNVLKTACAALTALDPDTGRAASALAQTWKFAPGAQKLSVQLKPNLKFHDGTPVNAQAVRESLSRVARPGSSSPWSSLVSNIVGFADLQAGMATHLSGVRSTGASQLDIELTQPFSDLPTVLAHPALSPVSLKSLAAEPGGPDLPVCAGPYRIRASGPNEYRLTKMPAKTGDAAKRAFGEPGRPQSIVIKGFDHPQDAFHAFEAGEVDVAPVAESQLPQAEGQRGFARSPGAETTFLAFDASKPETANPALRQAISLAIDRLVMIDAAFGDQRQPALRWLPEGFGTSQPSVCSEFARKVADPARAKARLGEAGIGAESVKLPLIFDSGQFGRLAAQAIQVQLAEVLGVEVEPKPMDAEAFAASLQQKSQAAIWITDTNIQLPIPDELLGALFQTGSPRNVVAFSDQEVDARIDRARRAATAEETARLWAQAENAVCDKMPAVPLWRASGQWITNPDKVSVQGDSVLDVVGQPILRRVSAKNAPG